MLPFHIGLLCNFNKQSSRKYQRYIELYLDGYIFYIIHRKVIDLIIFQNKDWRMGEQLFDLEGVAHHLTNRMVKGQEMDAVHKVKIEYGLALLLGVMIELVLTVGVSAIFGTIVYTLVIIFSALALRVFTGGSHCSSYRRCLVFSMAFFTGLSLAARWIASQINVYPLIEVILIPANLGILFQAFMQTAIGKNFVLASDKLMQKIGI